MRIIFLLFLLLGLCAGAAEPTAPPGALVRVWQSQYGLPSNVVRSVVQSSDGYLWVATAEGVARFDGYEFEVIEPEGELRRVRLAFSRLFTTSNGGVWAATYQGGLFKVHQGRLRRILDNIRSPSPRVTQLIEHRKGAVFFKRGQEFGEIDADGGVAQVDPSGELVRAFEDDFHRRVILQQLGEAAEFEVRGFLEKMPALLEENVVELDGLPNLKRHHIQVLLLDGVLIDLGSV